MGKLQLLHQGLGVLGVGAGERKGRGSGGGRAVRRLKEAGSRKGGGEGNR